MELNRLIKMANEIGEFFGQLPREEAITATTAHLKNFWAPRMRREIIDYAAGDGAELAPLVLAAVRRLERPAAHL